MSSHQYSPFHHASLIKLRWPCAHHRPRTPWRCVCLCAEGHCVGGFHYQNHFCRRGREARHEKRPRDKFLVLGHYQNEGVNKTRHLASLGAFLNVELSTNCVLNLRDESYTSFFCCSLPKITSFSSKQNVSEDSEPKPQDPFCNLKRCVICLSI